MGGKGLMDFKVQLSVIRYLSPGCFASPMDNSRGHRVCGHVIARSLVPRSSSPKIPPISKEGRMPILKKQQRSCPDQTRHGYQNICSWENPSIHHDIHEQCTHHSIQCGG